MLGRMLFVLLLGVGTVHGEPGARTGLVYLCPMHAQVRRADAGACPRCGMALVSSVRATYDTYALDVHVDPPQVPAGQPITIDLSVIDPATGSSTQDLRVVHERTFHLFVISDDLAWFEHVHPEPITGGAFRVRARLPRQGRYQLIADFFPEAGTPQLVQHALVTEGYAAPLVTTPLRLDGQRERRTKSVRVALSSLDLVSARENRLELTITDERGNPVRDLQPYLGAHLHALLLSSDFENAVHTHGELVPDRPGVIAFDVRPPRSVRYRLWVQVQRDGDVITVPFTVSASPARPSP